MSCNKCKSSPCACSDHGLTTPCSYTDCTDPTAETCEELHYMKCVSYSGNTFQVFNNYTRHLIVLNCQKNYFGQLLI